MPLTAIRALSKSQNGVGAHILPCLRLSFHYCDFGGSSKGMKSFLSHNLRDFAVANPSIEIIVSPRPNHHPVIQGHYANGSQKAICVRSLEPAQVKIMAERLKNTNGRPWTSVKKPVKSMNESVRGIYSVMHDPGVKVGDDGLWGDKKKSKKRKDNIS